jgi:hypothetical protein
MRHPISKTAQMRTDTAVLDFIRNGGKISKICTVLSGSRDEAFDLFRTSTTTGTYLCDNGGVSWTPEICRMTTIARHLDRFTFRGVSRIGGAK